MHVRLNGFGANVRQHVCREFYFICEIPGCRELLKDNHVGARLVRAPILTHRIPEHAQSKRSKLFTGRLVRELFVSGSVWYFMCSLYCYPYPNSHDSSTIVVVALVVLFAVHLPKYKHPQLGIWGNHYIVIEIVNRLHVWLTIRNDM